MRPSITVQIDSSPAGFTAAAYETIKSVAESVIGEFFFDAEVQIEFDYHPNAVCIKDPWDNGDDGTPAILLLEDFVLRSLDNALERHGLELGTVPRAETTPLLRMFLFGDQEQDPDEDA